MTAIKIIFDVYVVIGLVIEILTVISTMMYNDVVVMEPKYKAYSVMFKALQSLSMRHMFLWMMFTQFCWPALLPMSQETFERIVKKLKWI